MSSPFLIRLAIASSVFSSLANFESRNSRRAACLLNNSASSRCFLLNSLVVASKLISSSSYFNLSWTYCFEVFFSFITDLLLVNSTFLFFSTLLLYFAAFAAFFDFLSAMLQSGGEFGVILWSTLMGPCLAKNYVLGDLT